MIQVTGAGAGNGRPHRAPPKGAAVTGVQVHAEAYARAATTYHTSAFRRVMCLYTFVHSSPCVLCCVCVRACAL